MEINIPEYLKLYNGYKVDGEQALAGAAAIESKGKPATAQDADRASDIARRILIRLKL